MTRRGAGSRCIALVCGLLRGAWLPGTAWLPQAQISLPSGTKANVNGLTLTLDTQWVEGRGYRPVRIDVTCTQPTTVDRTLEIELGSRRVADAQLHYDPPGDRNSGRHGQRLDDHLGAPIGPDAIRLARRLGRRPASGRLIDQELLRRRRSFWRLEHGRNAGATVRHHEASRSVETGVPGRSPSNRGGRPLPNTTGVSSASQVATFIERTPSELVENWIDYTSLDVVFLSLADAQSLAQTRPKAWRALADWTRAGGNLCVYGVGDDWHGLEAIETLLQAPATPQKAAQPKRGFNEPDKQFWGRRISQGSVPLEQQTERANEQEASTNSDSSDDQPDADAPTNSPPSAAVQPDTASAPPGVRHRPRLDPRRKTAIACRAAVPNRRRRVPSFGNP